MGKKQWSAGMKIKTNGQGESVNNLRNALIVHATQEQQQQDQTNTTNNKHLTNNGSIYKHQSINNHQYLSVLDVFTDGPGHERLVVLLHHPHLGTQPALTSNLRRSDLCML